MYVITIDSSNYNLVDNSKEPMNYYIILTKCLYIQCTNIVFNIMY